MPKAGQLWRCINDRFMLHHPYETGIVSTVSPKTGDTLLVVGEIKVGTLRNVTHYQILYLDRLYEAPLNYFLFAELCETK